jgi:aldose 1-epimerase
MVLQRPLFQADLSGKKTDLYELKNASGMYVAITNYGARVVALQVPDALGKIVDVVLGLGSVDEYIKTSDPYYGCVVGRYANRIANGKFILNNKSFQLPVNNGPNHLHGGPEGFHTAVWDITNVNESAVEMKYFSKDGEQGYPGNLTTTVRYSITEANELEISYEATSDSVTVVNLTNHAFFNLNGEGSGSVEQHQLIIQADYFLPVNDTLIPVGLLQPVDSTPFDFRRAQTIGSRIHQQDSQLIIGRGYDHTFVINGTGNELRKAATATGDRTGICMDVYTTEPGMQLYTGNFMLGRNRLKSGAMDKFRTAFCLETQHYPDSPNQPAFPKTVLEPGKVFRSTTVYQFICR